MFISFKDYCIDNNRIDLLSQWDIEKNLPITPETISFGSNRRIHWHCEKGHHWTAILWSRQKGTGKCPICSNKKIVTGINDLKSQYPALMQQWHTRKNQGLDPSQISPGTHRSVWWICEHGHEWRAEIRTRTLGECSCPVCTGKKVKAGFNDLATKYPRIAKEWHPKKNADLTPEQVLGGSVRKVWWRCAKGHEWRAEIASRCAGLGCPICSNKIIVPGENDFASKYPQIADEWDSEKNGALEPTQVSASSNRAVWWKCPLGHSYKAKISSKTSRLDGCPYCAGKKVLEGFNDLASQKPAVADQWHPTLNGKLLPSQVTKGSNKYVWWICGEGHVWKAVIYARTGKRPTGCPVCAGRKDKYAFLNNRNLP